MVYIIQINIGDIHISLNLFKALLAVPLAVSLTVPLVALLKLFLPILAAAARSKQVSFPGKRRRIPKVRCTLLSGREEAKVVLGMAPEELRERMQQYYGRYAVRDKPGCYSIPLKIMTNSEFSEFNVKFGKKKFIILASELFKIPASELLKTNIL